MRILHINYYFPPILNARSIRWLNFVKYLKGCGHDVDILTISPKPGMASYLEGSESNIPSDLRVIRTYPGILHHINFGILGRSRGQYSAHGSVLSRRNRLFRGITFLRNCFRKIVFFFWRNVVCNLLIPDQFVDWWPIGTFAGIRLMKKDPYPCIISSGLPHTDHLVAFILKLFWPKTFWVADYGDPWSFSRYPPRNKFIQLLHRFIERTLLKTVDCIIVTTEETRGGFLQHFSFLNATQVITIPQGCDTHMIAQIPTDQRAQFTVGYIGRFDSIRDPLPFFRALSILKDRNYVFRYLNVGVLQDYYAKAVEDLGLGDCVRLLGPRSHADALRIAKSCHVLLYWGNDSTYQLPSKIWEYLALEKPILCVTRHPEDIGARIVREFHRGIIVPCDPHRIAAAIRHLNRLWQTGTLDEHFDLSSMLEIDYRQRAHQLDRALHALSHHMEAPVRAD